MVAHDKSLAVVFNVLCGLSAVASFLAAAVQQSAGWTFLLASCALACYEAATGLAG